MNGNLDLFNSSSREPSRTIKISPTVPSPGNKEVKSGTGSCRYSVPCFTAQPTSSKNITEGIFVFEEVMSNIYASINKRHIDIMIDVVIFGF